MGTPERERAREMTLVLVINYRYSFVVYLQFAKLNLLCSINCFITTIVQPPVYSLSTCVGRPKGAAACTELAVLDVRSALICASYMLMIS